ncbi:hypothetical protein K457DRAFT_12705 [Linnemannia elongata AG-77]|uniref:Uncharacterized protein n=1 Tax=Linnemannia elongata AG-77 TaxID=1314771 RepID=A0A197KF99_9FUNG|nr:hypothetical protein K457DRAFT_12705 [Linnemannia elongata AG-77]
MKIIASMATIAMAIGLATATTLHSEADTLVQTFGTPRFHSSAVREDTYSEATTIIPQTLESDNMVVPHSTDQEVRSSTYVPTHDISAKREPYTWDFETFSQNNYIGDRQRFNGDGCVNFHCVEVRGYKGLPNKEYIFYEGDDCYGAVILRTTDEMRDQIEQPFKPCSIRVQYPPNYNGWGNPPSGSDLVLYGQPWYKGSSSAKLSGKKCRELKGQGVVSYKAKANQTYTFYRDAGCKGKVLEKSNGPNSRTNTYLTPMSVKIE